MFEFYWRGTKHVLYSREYHTIWGERLVNALERGSSVLQCVEVECFRIRIISEEDLKTEIGVVVAE
jgi:hypothetical protein